MAFPAKGRYIAIKFVKPREAKENSGVKRRFCRTTKT